MRLVCSASISLLLCIYADGDVERVEVVAACVAAGVIGGAGVAELLCRKSRM